VSSRYFFEEPGEVLNRLQVRRFEVEASLAKNGREYNGRYKTSVTPV